MVSSSALNMRVPQLRIHLDIDTRGLLSWESRICTLSQFKHRRLATNQNGEYARKVPM